MRELQIPTRRIHVEIHMTTGARVTGSLFVHDSPFYSGSPEDVLHDLNDEREFLPIAVDDDVPAFVVSKAHIVRVRLPWGEDTRPGPVCDVAPEDASASTLLLSDGSCVKGTLVLPTPCTSSRVVDKLNLAPTFIPLVTADGMQFVRKSHVVHVS